MQSDLLRNPLRRRIDQRHQPLFIVLRASIPLEKANVIVDFSGKSVLTT
jgi:hypothetical protein